MQERENCWSVVVVDMLATAVLNTNERYDANDVKREPAVNTT